MEIEDPSILVTWAKFFLIIPFIYLATVALPKLALLTIYLSIFIQKPLRMACWFVGAVVICNWFAATVAGLRACIPLNLLWNPTPGGHCFDLNSWFRWSSFANILSDVVMLILPIPLVLNLQVSKGLKLGLLVTFLLGSM